MVRAWLAVCPMWVALVKVISGLSFIEHCKPISLKGVTWDPPSLFSLIGYELSI